MRNDPGDIEDITEFDDLLEEYLHPDEPRRRELRETGTADGKEVDANGKTVKILVKTEMSEEEAVELARQAMQKIMRMSAM
jgi:hypothetical protein